MNGSFTYPQILTILVWAVVAMAVSVSLTTALLLIIVGLSIMCGYSRIAGRMPWNKHKPNQ